MGEVIRLNAAVTCEIGRVAQRFVAMMRESDELNKVGATPQEDARYSAITDKMENLAWQYADAEPETPLAKLFVLICRAYVIHEEQVMASCGRVIARGEARYAQALSEIREHCKRHRLRAQDWGGEYLLGTFYVEEK